MRADSCSGPTTDSICGHGLGRMGHSSNFARWPHLGPIPPMDGGGHLVPLSYVYGYRGGVGRRGVAQDTIGDNGLEIRARVRRYQLILWRCAAGFVPKSAISEISRSGQRKNGRSGGNFLSTARCAWAVLGGIPSGWGQFGAVKKLLSFIGGLRRQLNALYTPPSASSRYISRLGCCSSPRAGNRPKAGHKTQEVNIRSQYKKEVLQRVAN